MKTRPAQKNELATPRGQRKQQADAARKRVEIDVRSNGIETDVAVIRLKQRLDGEAVAAKARALAKFAATAEGATTAKAAAEAAKG